MTEYPFSHDQEIEPEKEKKRRPYSKPHLQELGDLRGLTLSGSPGFMDSDHVTGEPYEI